MDFTASGILKRMKSELKNEDTKIEGSFSMDNLQAVSEEIARFNAMLIVPLMEYLDDRESDMGTSGNERHYIQWAKEAKDGNGLKIAGNAKVSAPRDATGNVYVAIVTASATAPTPEQIQTVQNYIDTHRPAGANPVVSAAESIPVQILCSVMLKPGYTKETAQTLIETAICEYLTDIAFKSGIATLNYYRIGNIIGDAEGIRDLSELTLNGLKESITADYDKFFSLEELTVNVT